MPRFSCGSSLSQSSEEPAWVQEVETPALVMDERPVRQALAVLDRLRRDTGARILYTLKPSVHRDLLVWMRDRVDGFAASSLFEAMWGREVLGPGKAISITTPCYREDQIDPIAGLCDHVVLNSLPQFERFRSRLNGRTSIGLRINPELSVVSDARYDPCRPHSKLGTPMASVREVLSDVPDSLAELEGLHFHTNCESESYEPLLRTVNLVAGKLEPLLRSVRWINLGGGYLFSAPGTFAPLHEAISLLQERYELTVFLEPGAALVRAAGYLVSTVTDLFTHGDATIAVLDTSVNHVPEVFEYQLEPDVLGHALDHPFRYLLAGASCLAGDLFGEHRFARPLEIGSRLVFPNMGAYTLVKSHFFNGINRPSLYSIAMDGSVHLRRRFDYDDYKRHMGLESPETHAGAHELGGVG
jgi:carboxynorspermidine decarboxylase